VGTFVVGFLTSLLIVHVKEHSIGSGGHIYGTEWAPTVLSALLGTLGALALLLLWLRARLGWCALRLWLVCGSAMGMVAGIRHLLWSRDSVALWLIFIIWAPLACATGFRWGRWAFDLSFPKTPCGPESTASRD